MVPGEGCLTGLHRVLEWPFLRASERGKQGGQGRGSGDVLESLLKINPLVRAPPA